MSEPFPIAIAALADMGDEQLCDFIGRHLGQDEPAEMWGFLMSPEVVTRTRSALTILLNDVNLQIAAESARMDSLPRMSPAGYQQERREHSTRRGRALGYKRHLERRLRQVKDAEQAARQARHSGYMADRDAPCREAARKLAVAIAAHRDAVIASGVTPEKSDVDLWAVLTEARVPYYDGFAPVAELLADGAWADTHPRTLRAVREAGTA
jgi:hypothetical protein